MKQKRTIGVIMFLTGVLLKELSYVVEIWIIHFLISALASIIGLAGAAMAIKAMICLNNKKTNEGPEQENSSPE